MKEASGELNMTVVTIIAITAVGALFYVFIWPVIQKSIVGQTCKTYGPDWVPLKGTSVIETGSNAKVQEWYCCPAGYTQVDTTNCIGADTGNTTSTGD